MDAKLMLILVSALCAVAAFPSQLPQVENELDNVAIDNSNDLVQCHYIDLEENTYCIHVYETPEVDACVRISPPLPQCGYVEVCNTYSVQTNHLTGSIEICHEPWSSGHCYLLTEGPPATCTDIIMNLEDCFCAKDSLGNKICRPHNCDAGKPDVNPPEEENELDNVATDNPTEEENELDNVATDNPNDLVQCHYVDLDEITYCIHVYETPEVDACVRISPPLPKCDYVEVCKTYSVHENLLTGSVKICNEPWSSGHCYLPTEGPPATCNDIIMNLEDCFCAKDSLGNKICRPHNCDASKPDVNPTEEENELDNIPTDNPTEEENEVDNVPTDNPNDLVQCHYIDLEEITYCLHVYETSEVDACVRISPPLPKCGYVEVCKTYSVHENYLTGSVKICNEHWSSGHCYLPTEGPPPTCTDIIMNLEDCFCAKDSLGNKICRPHNCDAGVNAPPPKEGLFTAYLLALSPGSLPHVLRVMTLGQRSSLTLITFAAFCPNQPPEEENEADDIATDNPSDLVQCHYIDLEESTYCIHVYETSEVDACVRISPPLPQCGYVEVCNTYSVHANILTGSIEICHEPWSSGHCYLPTEGPPATCTDIIMNLEDCFCAVDSLGNKICRPHNCDASKPDVNPTEEENELDNAPTDNPTEEENEVDIPTDNPSDLVQCHYIDLEENTYCIHVYETSEVDACVRISPPLPKCDYVEVCNTYSVQTNLLTGSIDICHEPWSSGHCYLPTEGPPATCTDTIMNLEDCFCAKDSLGNKICRPPNCDAGANVNSVSVTQQDHCVCIENSDGVKVCTPANCDARYM